MTQVHWTPMARSSLDEIFDYIAVEKANPTAAARLLRQINAQCRHFARHPTSGHPRPDLAEGVRCFLIGKYVVYYRQRPDGIEILLIAHGARDVPGLFRRLYEGGEEE